MELNENTFKDLVRRQRDLIWQVCSTYRLSAAWTTEDAFHEVLCALWQGYDSFDGRSAERTWVYRVATNTMLMLKRKMSNQPQPDALPRVDEAAPTDSHRQDLQETIATLGDLDRQIVQASLDGFSLKEIAEMTGLSIVAVGTRLSRAKSKIRKFYEKGI